MIPLRLIMEGDGAFQDQALDQNEMGVIKAAAYLANGTQDGNATICLLVEVDGVEYVCETTHKLFNLAAQAFSTRYGNPNVD